MIIDGYNVAEQVSGEPAACAAYLSWGRNQLATLIRVFGPGPWTRHYAPAPGVTVQLSMGAGSTGLIRVVAEGGIHGFVFRPVDLADAAYGWGSPYTPDNRPLGSTLQDYYGAARGQATLTSGRGPYNVLEVKYKGDDPQPLYTRHRGVPSFDKRVVNVGDIDWVWRGRDGKLRGYLTWGSPSTGRGIVFPGQLNFDSYPILGHTFFGDGRVRFFSTAGAFPYCLLRPGSRIDWTGGYGFEYANQVGELPQATPRVEGIDRMQSNDSIRFTSASVRRTTKAFMNGGVFFDFKDWYVMGAAIGPVQGEQCLIAVVANGKVQLEDPTLKLVAVKLSDRKSPTPNVRTLAVIEPQAPYQWCNPEAPGTWTCNFDFSASATECAAIVPLLRKEPLPTGPASDRNALWHEVFALVRVTNIPGGAPAVSIDYHGWYTQNRSSNSSSWSGSMTFACGYKGDELRFGTISVAGSSSWVHGGPPTFDEDLNAWQPSGEYSTHYSASETISICGKTFSLGNDHDITWHVVRHPTDPLFPHGAYYDEVVIDSESWGSNKGMVFLYADFRDDYLLYVDVRSGSGTTAGTIKDSFGEAFYTYSADGNGLYGFIDGSSAPAIPSVTETVYPWALATHCWFPVGLTLDASHLGTYASVSLLMMPASQRLATGDRLTSIEILPSGNSINAALPNAVESGNTTYEGAQYVTRLYRKDKQPVDPWAHIPLPHAHRALFDLGVM